MCFSIIKNTEIISIIFVYYFSVIVADNIKLAIKTANFEHLTSLSNIVTELLYNSPEYPKTIIIPYDKHNEIDLKSLKNLQSKSSVILTKMNFSMKKKIIHTKKIDAVILYIKNYKNKTLTSMLSKFTMTPWKNPMLTFYIIDNSLDKCSHVDKLLKIMWKFRIISYFVCRDRLGHFWIYTFNPFSKWAPFPWQVIRTSNYLDSRWTLLQQKYQKEYIIKNPLEFDRLTVLDGYRLSFGCIGKNLAESESPLESFIKTDRLSVIYMNAIMMTLNFPGKCNYISTSREGDNHKTKIGKQIFQLDVDIISARVISIAVTHSIYDFERTFPIFYHQWGILTINRGYKTPFEKIQDFYGIWVLLYTIVVLLVTFIVIYLFEQRRIYFAAFEIIRLLINTGLYTRMDTVPRRLFFSVIFIYFLIIQATFSGNLTNFLTKPILKRHPETLDDLKDLSYNTIYGVYSLNYSMTNDIKFISSNVCWNYLKNNTKAACIHDHDSLRIKAFHNPFYYVNRQPFGYFYRYFYVRTNWLLLDKVNQAIMRVWQSGLQLHWQKGYFSRHILKANVHEAKSLFVYAPIKLDNLIFAFIILSFGLSCATLSFFIEFSRVYIHTFNIKYGNINLNFKCKKIIHKN